MVALLTAAEKALHRWECDYVDSRDGSQCDKAVASAVLAHVWSLAGLPGKSPTVTVLGRDDEGYIHGALAYVEEDGWRMVMQRPTLPTVTVLHEAAHLLTEDPLDRAELRRLQEREFHGPIWLSNYLWLLDRLMGPKFNMFYLRQTLPAVAREWDVKYAPVIWGGKYGPR